MQNQNDLEGRVVRLFEIFMSLADDRLASVKKAEEAVNQIKLEVEEGP